MDCFFLFCYWTTQQITIMKKTLKKTKKKALGRINILHNCTVSDNDMIHSSWDIKRDGHIFLSFLIAFSLLSSPYNSENQNFEKLRTKETTGDIINLKRCTKNCDYILYCSLDVTTNRFNCCLSFLISFWSFISIASLKFL